jgi:hypothetical protein
MHPLLCFCSCGGSPSFSHRSRLSPTPRHVVAREGAFGGETKTRRTGSARPPPRPSCRRRPGRPATPCRLANSIVHVNHQAPDTLKPEEASRPEEWSGEVERRCVLPPRLTWEEDANHQDVLFSSVRNESLENCLYDVGVDDDVDWAGL